MWDWLQGFYESYLPRIEARAILNPGHHAAWRHEMARLADEGTTTIVAPTMADAILRKPA